MANKQIAILGVTLLALPVVLRMIDTTFLNCVDEYAFFPSTSSLFDSVFSSASFIWFFLFCFTGGLILILGSYLRWRLRKIVNTWRAVVEVFMFLVVLFVCVLVFFAQMNISRSGGHTAVVKSIVNNERAVAEMFYVAHKGTYEGLCDDATVREHIKQIQSILPEQGRLCSTKTPIVVCVATKEAYVFSAKLPKKPETYFCTDSTGTATESNVSHEGTRCMK